MRSAEIDAHVTRGLDNLNFINCQHKKTVAKVINLHIEVLNLHVVSSISCPSFHRTRLFISHQGSRRTHDSHYRPSQTTAAQISKSRRQKLRWNTTSLLLSNLGCLHSNKRVLASSLVDYNSRVFALWADLDTISKPPKKIVLSNHMAHNTHS